MYCSIQQAVEIFDELRDAMEGKHGYGGYTAEIYAYRLLPNIPSGRKYEIAEMIRASRSLVAIIDLFRDKYNDAVFLIDGLEYHSWLEKYGATFDHRVYVHCLPKIEKLK
jgi:hypothetical protein